MDTFLLPLLILKRLEGIGPVRINTNYLSQLMSINSLDELSCLIGKLEPKLSDSSILQAREDGTALYEKINADNTIRAITALDSDYPYTLNQLGKKKPVVIYVKGNQNLLMKKSICVIGTRKPSERTMRSGPDIVKKLIQVSKCPIVSGLAQGCDGIAHETALDCNAETVAVLPSGFNNIYPSVHKEIADRIVLNGGCLISEYEPDEKAQKYTAVRRDTIMAALSAGTVVLECGMKSGTMHTVNSAIELGRQIACFIPSDNYSGYDGNQYIVKSEKGTAITYPSDIHRFVENVLI